MPLFYKFQHPLIYLKRILPELIGQNLSQSKPKLEKKMIDSSRQSFSKINSEYLRQSFFEGLRRDIANIKAPELKTQWRDYYADIAAYLENKKSVIGDILERIGPKTVLDIGCNTGEFSKLAAEKGASVVAFDSDDYTIEALAQES